MMHDSHYEQTCFQYLNSKAQAEKSLKYPVNSLAITLKKKASQTNHVLKLGLRIRVSCMPPGTRCTVSVKLKGKPAHGLYSCSCSESHDTVQKSNVLYLRLTHFENIQHIYFLPITSPSCQIIRFPIISTNNIKPSFVLSN